MLPTSRDDFEKNSKSIKTFANIDFINEISKFSLKKMKYLTYVLLYHLINIKFYHYHTKHLFSYISTL